ncbi:hypothetical protein MRX96_026467 [Rhipicephalus microplus]
MTRSSPDGFVFSGSLDQQMPSGLRPSCARASALEGESAWRSFYVCGRLGVRKETCVDDVESARVPTVRLADKDPRQASVGRINCPSKGPPLLCKLGMRDALTHSRSARIVTAIFVSRPSSPTPALRAPWRSRPSPAIPSIHIALCPLSRAPPVPLSESLSFERVRIFGRRRQSEHRWSVELCRSCARDYGGPGTLQRCPLAFSVGRVVSIAAGDRRGLGD